MKNVEKADMQKTYHVKRTRRRKKNTAGFYFLLIFIVTTLGITLSMTLLFNISKFEIVGSTKYSPEEIIKSSGVMSGDNMVRLKTDNVKEKILSELTYIDDVTIKKKFPNTLVIELVVSKPIIYVKYENEYLVISEGFRILSKMQSYDETLILIEGFDADFKKLGDKLKSLDKNKEKILKDMLFEIQKLDFQNIKSINLTDKYNLSYNYDNRINVKISDYSDLEYKMKSSKPLLTEKISSVKKGDLVYLKKAEYSFREEQTLITESVETEGNVEVTQNVETDSQNTENVIN